MLDDEFCADEEEVKVWARHVDGKQYLVVVRKCLLDEIPRSDLKPVFVFGANRRK